MKYWINFFWNVKYYTTFTFATGWALWIGKNFLTKCSRRDQTPMSCLWWTALEAWGPTSKRQSLKSEQSSMSVSRLTKTRFAFYKHKFISEKLFLFPILWYSSVILTSNLHRFWPNSYKYNRGEFIRLATEENCVESPFCQYSQF